MTQDSFLLRALKAFVVLGGLLIVSSAANVRLLLTRRRVSVRQVASARAGFPVRSALLAAALGLWDLTREPAFTAVMVAIIAWEIIVQAAAVVRTRVSHQS